MKDPRIEILAQNIMHNSIKVQKGERVLIQNNNVVPEFVKALVRKAYEAGAIPFVSLKDISIERELMLGATEEQLKIRAEIEVAEMKQMNCFIGFRAMKNLYEQADVPAEKMSLYDKLYYEPVHMQQRLNHTKWVVLRWPTAAMAQLSGMSQEAFEDFYFRVCNLDYSKMGKAMKALKEYMERTDQVRIVGPGTDLKFSIKNIPANPCAGECNIPDGEVYTAPVRESVNGTLTYNTPAVYQGFTYENISFRFENGKIVEATANDTVRINHVLDTDEGARYIGEFAIGVNPYILKPMKDTLFDEKIMGSFHFTPGNCYEDAPNGNSSAIHWDLVCIQTPEYGGGEIYFDDVLIRKDGRFVVKELEVLNPENLV